MPVSIKKHLLIVSFLVVILLVLSTILLMVLFHLGPFRVVEEVKLAIPQHYLKEEEAVVIPPNDGQKETVVLPITKVLFEYVEVVDGCGPHFEGSCVRVRSGPGEEYAVVTRLRNGAVLRVGGKVERDGRTWYKIAFNEWIRYPARVSQDWYITADYVKALLDEGERIYPDGVNASSTKRIIVKRRAQKLYAYEGEVLFMETRISTGVELTPTPRGAFTVFKKTPSRYMQGPIPGISDQYYDLPGVPWNLYFTEQGAVIHGAYWHNNFGKRASHGCVNLLPEEAKKLYLWAEVGTRVVVQD